jgi:hypothetical protein
MILPFGLWAIAILLCAILFGVLIHQKTYLRFPVFFVYIVVRLVGGIFEMAAYHHRGSIYYFTYWTVVTLRFALQFALLYEITNFLLKPYPAIPRTFCKFMCGSMAVAAFVSTAISCLAPSSRTDKLSIYLIATQRTSLMAWCSSFLVLAICSSWLGLGWPRKIVSMAAGCLALSASGMIAGLLYTALSLPHHQIVGRIDSAVTVVVLAFWVYALSRPETKLSVQLTLEELVAIRQLAMDVSRNRPARGELCF